MPRTKQNASTKGAVKSPQQKQRSPNGSGGTTNGPVSPRNSKTRRPNAKSRSNSVSQTPIHHQQPHAPSQSQHQSQHNSAIHSKQITPMNSTTPQRLVPPLPNGGVTKMMSPEAKLAWNLKILRRHDPLISRIYDQCPYGVLYTFAHAAKNTESEAGKGKYEGHWEKTNIEGTVFIIERSAFPHYGFFLLNRGGTSSIVQMFHEHDMIEVGTDTKFLTFRPGLWNRATTPYDEPFTECVKPELICLWLSDEAAGPRFARFMLRVNERLAWMAEHGESEIPPMTPLSQMGDLSPSESSSNADESPSPRYNSAPTKEATIKSQESPSRNSTMITAALAIERPLDKLFASLVPGPPAAGSATPVSIEPQPIETVISSDAGPNLSLERTGATQTTLASEANGKALLESLFRKPPTPTNPTVVATPPLAAHSQPRPLSGLSLLDAIFASARASDATQPSAVNSLNNISRGDPHQLQQIDRPVTPPPRLALHNDVNSSDDDSSVPVKNNIGAQANGARYKPTVAASTGDASAFSLPSLSRNYLTPTTPAHVPPNILDQPQAPSPSIIPNPPHTPKPTVMSRRQRAKAKSEMNQRSKGIPLELEGAVEGISSAIRETNTGRAFDNLDHVAQENPCPGDCVEKHPGVNPDAASSCLLAAYENHAAHSSLPSTALSKHDFVHNIKLLLHEDTDFADDLYCRYQALLVQQQQQQP